MSIYLTKRCLDSTKGLFNGEQNKQRVKKKAQNIFAIYFVCLQNNSTFAIAKQSGM
jgi:hypothetical protein